MFHGEKWITERALRITINKHPHKLNDYIEAMIPKLLQTFLSSGSVDEA